MPVKRILLGTTALSVALGWGGAFAQPATEVTLETVVITAEKRSEDIQKTPVAVSAVSQDALARAGITQLANLEKVVPDVKLARQGTAMTVQVRGVWSTDTSPGSDPAVGVHVNGAYLSKAQGMQGFLYDLERVEVLKGPQGTLYGRNTNGGTLNLITNKASLDGRDAAMDVEYGSYNLMRLTGHVNMPLSDSVAVRAAFQTFSHDGFLKSGLDDAAEQSGRVSFLWKPDEDQSLWVVADLSRQNNKGDGVANIIGALQPSYTSNNGQGSAPNSTNRAYVYVPSDPRDDTFNSTGVLGGRASAQKRDQTNRGLTAQYDRNIGFATWSTEAAWRRFDGYAYNANQPAQAAARSYLNGTNDASCPAITIPASTAGTTTVATNCYWQGSRNYNPQHFESYSFETRLTSADTKPLQWVAGLYLFQSHNWGTMIGYGSLATSTRSIEIANPYELARSAAAFGQVTWTPDNLDALHVTLGGRLNVDHKTANGIFTYSFNNSTGTPALLLAASPNEYSHTWRAATYKAGISYDITDANLLYGSVSTGYKAGGYAYGPGSNPAANLGPIYKPERITAFEIGSKNRFLDDTLQINVEAFYYKYKDYQTNLTVYTCPTPSSCYGGPINTSTSAGQATYKGVTVDGQWAVTQDDFVRASWSAVNANYGTFIITAAPGYGLNLSGTTTQNTSGTNLPAVARWTGMASYSHTFENVWNGSLDAEFDARFRGPIMFSYSVDTTYGVVTTNDHAWGMYDLSLKYVPQDGNWSATAYVRNLTDETKPVFEAYSTTTKAISAYFFDPRIIGVIFSAKL